MLSFLYVYSDHSILECYNLFSGVELSMRSFSVIWCTKIAKRILGILIQTGATWHFDPVTDVITNGLRYFGKN